MKARRAGVIVNIGSVNGLAALGDPAYSAGKAGMISLTQALAMEYGRYGIRANIVCPGHGADADLGRALEAQSGSSRAADALVSARPHRRADRDRAAVGFLASDAAAAITGVALPVDCGLTAGNIVMARELTLEDF